MNLDEIILDFDERVNDYNLIMNEVIPYYSNMNSTIAEFIPNRHDEVIKLLDLGCGIGNTTKAILDRFPLAQVTGVDLSPKALSVYNSRFHNKNVSSILGNICDDTSFIDNYDCIVSNLAMVMVN